MKNMENEYKKRFKNQKMDNSDFDVDGLWDAIADDLDGETTPPTPPKGNDPLFKYLGFGLAILLLTGLGFTYLSKTDTTRRLATKENINKEQKQTQNTNNQGITHNPTQTKEVTNTTIQKTSAEQIPSSNKNSNQTTTSIKKTKNSLSTTSPNHAKKGNKQTKSTDNRFSRKSNIKNKAPKPTTSNSQNQDSNIKDNNSLASSNSSNQSQSPTNAAPTKELTPNKTKPSLSSLEKNQQTTEIKNQSRPTQSTNSPKQVDKPTLAVIAKDSTTAELQKSPAAPSQPADSMTDNTDQNSTETNDDITPESTNINQEKKSLDSLTQGEEQIPAIKPTHVKNVHWNISLFGGTNKLFMKFNSKDELAQLRNDYEKGTWGTSYGLNVDMVWKDKFILSSGLEHHTLWSKIDFTQEKTWTQDSVLQEVIISPTGEILSLTYDSLARSSKKRTVWNNQYKTYRIPLEIGYQHHINHWTMGAKFGAILNITNTQKGKTFNQEQVITYFTQADSFAPLKSFQVGFRFSPFLGFQVTDRTQLSLAPKWNWYKGQTADIQEFGIGIGIGIKF